MMMKVQCDSCGTRYKLDESRIKGKGARITCPKCGHTFVVYRNPGDFDDEEPATIIADRGSLFPRGMSSQAQLGTGTGGASFEDELESGPATIVDMPAMPRTTPGHQGHKDLSGSASPSGAEAPPNAADMAETAPTFPRPTSASSLNWREVGVTAFKVKVSYGLVFDFSDVPLLKKYLAEKKVQSSDLLSFDGKEWTPINKLGNLESYFITKWVELKRAQLGEEIAETVKSGRLPPISTEPKPASPRPTGSSAFLPPSAGGASAQAPGRPRGPVEDASLDALFDGAGTPEPSPTPSARSTAGQGGASASGGADFSAGLIGDDLFAGLPEPEAPSHAHAPVHRGSTGADASLKSGPPPRAPREPREPMRPGQIALLVLLLLAAGGLGWLYFQGTQALAALEQRAETETVQGDAGIKGAVDALFPSLARVDAGAVAPPAPVAAPEAAPPQAAPEPEPGAPEVKGADAAKEGAAKGRRPRQPQAADVQVARISAEDLTELGDAQMSSGNYGAAITSYQQAVALKPKNGGYQVKLGYAQLKDGAAQAAVQSLERGLKLDAGQIDAHKWLGEALERVGRNRDARASYEQYVKARPKARDRAEIEARIARLS